MLSRYNTIVILLTIAGVILVLLYFPRTPVSQTSKAAVRSTQLEQPVVKEEEVSSKPQAVTLPTFTTESLALFNGEDPALPIYVAFKGDVYDVTEGKKFYGPDGHYHFLAGTDGTKLLKVFGASVIQEKYPVVGRYVE